jgi:hypothetical protein
MTVHGNVRIALWWTVCAVFLIILLGVPFGLKKKLQEYSPSVVQVAELAGILGAFSIILACLMLSAGEMPLAQAYMAANEDTKIAIVANYEWLRLATALLFDVLGFFLLGVWVFASSIVGLRSGSLPKGIGWFGTATGLLIFCLVVGYLAKIDWLGETGLGALAFLLMPVWLIWLGILLWKTNSSKF